MALARNGRSVVRKNVLIVDHHARLRTALRIVLEISVEVRVCGEAADGVEAIEKAGELKAGSHTPGYCDASNDRNRDGVSLETGAARHKNRFLYVVSRNRPKGCIRHRR
jgi:hypothetical protein